MVKRDLLVVNAVSDILEIKKENPLKMNSELIGIFIKINKLRLREDNKLLLIGYADKALKIKSTFPKISKKELIQTILEGVE
jgi:hypothetical protein